MRQYHIAFFTTDWNYELVETTLHGLKQFVDDHENVQLCVFDCFGKDVENAKDDSEYAIFELPDLKQFDGVLIQGNQIVLESARTALAKRVAEAGIPAVAVDCPIEGCALVSIDNRMAQHDIAAHVIREHNARRLVYLTGILDNGSLEAEHRMQGFVDACRENGVSDEDMEIFPCTWRTLDGTNVVERFMREGRPLPDAFICANDDMAIGVLQALRDFGIRVPRDVIVTGFDNLSSAELSSPRLSSVNRDYERLDYKALEVLLGRIDGTDTRDFVAYEYQIVCSESCGCSDHTRPAAVRDKYFEQVRFLKDFYGLQDQMAEDLFEASTLVDLMDIVEKNYRIFGCDRLYLCVNGSYYDNYDKNQWRRQSSRHFDDEMVLAGSAGVDSEAVDRLCRFPTSRLLPDAVMARERFLMFYPLHYNTYSIGYVALNSISEAAKLNLHMSIFNFLEIGIENVRKKCLLRQLNETLDDLYVHDALTGLYNRFGFERFAQRAFEGFIKQFGGARIVFMDMDNLKPVNDVFGHEIGDEAIRAAADVLRQACGPDDFLMRYGGDEFLAIVPLDESDPDAAIQEATRAANDLCDRPYRLGLSVGVIDVLAGDPRSLEECVQAADAVMYENKNRRKAAKTR